MKQQIARHITLVLLSFPLMLLFFRPIRQAALAWAGAPTSGAAWGTTYENDPTGADPINQGDDWINQLKTDVRERLAVEHDFGELSGSPTTDTGRHLEGSARAFYESAAPTTIPRTDNNNSGEASSAILDDGRLWHDLDTGELWIYNGSAFADAVDKLNAPTLTGTTTIANIASGTNLIGLTNLITTPRFGSTAGADPYNPLAFTIRSISVDTTNDGTACAPLAAVDTTALALQAFGDAGDACMSVTLDLSTRTYATSRVLVIGQYNLANDGGICGDNGTATGAHWAIFQDSMGTQLGDAIQLGGSSSGSVNHFPSTSISFNYITNLSNAVTPHEFAIHARADDVDCDYAASGITGRFLAVIDLGPAY